LDFKKKAFWSVLSLALAVFTIWFVIYRSGMSLSDFWNSLTHADFSWILTSFIAMFSFIFFEGVALLQIIRTCGHPRHMGRGFLYSATDIYLAAITPSGSGGQPGIIFFMMKDGIPGAVITAALVINFVAFNVGLLSWAAFGLIVSPGVFASYSTVCKVFILVGFGVFILGFVLGILMLRKREMIFRVAMKLVSFLHKIKLIKNPERLHRRLEKVMEEYKTTVDVVGGHKGMWFSACLMNVLQRFVQIAVTVFSFRALGGEGPVLDLFSTQALATIGATCVPIPGAMGISDYLMLEGYTNLMPKDFAFQVQMLSRGISFYACVIFSGITLVIGLLLLGRNKKK